MDSGASVQRPGWHGDLALRYGDGAGVMLAARHLISKQSFSILGGRYILKNT